MAILAVCIGPRKFADAPALGEWMQQIQLFDGITEASAYHSPGRRGFFALLLDFEGRKRQFCYRLDLLADVIQLLDHDRDSYISQAEFHSPRRLSTNVSQLGLLFADLDTYNAPNMAGKSPEAQAQALEWHCAEYGVPLPSIIVFSGRGLQAKWVLSNAIPRGALPRWHACQQALCAALAGFGSDRNALDASRVLRLVDTVNTKSGLKTRVVSANYDQPGQLQAYDFEFLCEVLLPIARDQLHRQQATRKGEQIARLEVLRGGRDHKSRGTGKGINNRVLAWDRLEDLRKLAKLREGWGEGMRSHAVMYYLNFMVMSGTVPAVNARREGEFLAREIYGADFASFDRSSLTTVIDKARRHAAGEKVIYRGQERPILYTPRNSTLIDLFQITGDEQQQLRTLIDKDESQRRNTARHTACRREAGAVPRAEYLAKAGDRAAQIVALKAQGLGATAIAQQLGVHRDLIYKTLRARQV